MARNRTDPDAPIPGVPRRGDPPRRHDGRPICFGRPSPQPVQVKTRQQVEAETARAIQDLYDAE